MQTNFLDDDRNHEPLTQNKQTEAFISQSIDRSKDVRVYITCTGIEKSWD